MAEPFVFHFKPGQHGEPLKMYIADIEGVCGLCKATQIQRFYHTAPFHALTYAQLASLAQDVPKKLDVECSNCGEQIGPEGAARSVLMWGFADDSGVLTAWNDGGDVQWTVVPNRRLDPQALPGFQPPDETFELDAEWLEFQIRRVLNPKTLWLELFGEFDANPDDLISAVAADGFIIGVGHAVAQEILAEDEGLIVSLCAEPKIALPYHARPEELFAHTVGWLSESRHAQLSSGEVYAGASIAIDPMRDMIERAFTVGNLSWRYDATTQSYIDIATPQELELGTALPLLAIAQRAVYTGMTPGEAARLTAEEIVGTFLGVWS